METKRLLVTERGCAVQSRKHESEINKQTGLLLLLPLLLFMANAFVLFFQHQQTGLFENVICGIVSLLKAKAKQKQKQKQKKKKKCLCNQISTTDLDFIFFIQQ